MPRLITIPISHYCERARWALDHAQVTYTESQHLQLFHRLATVPAGGTSTPLLMTDDGVFDDSADIVDYADKLAAPNRKLYPNDSTQRAAIGAFEREVAGRFGVETRRLIYWHFFAWGRGALRFNTVNAPRWQALTVAAALPLLRTLLERTLNVTDATAARAEERIAPFLDDVQQRLADGRPYLFGNTFTAADLTFAAMCAPLAMPPEYGVPMPAVAELPEATATLVANYRKHPACQFALRVYADRRRLP